MQIQHRTGASLHRTPLRPLAVRERPGVAVAMIKEALRKLDWLSAARRSDIGS
jgi:hypothetical protein